MYKFPNNPLEKQNQKKKIKIGNILHQKIPFRIETNNFKNL